MEHQHAERLDLGFTVRAQIQAKVVSLLPTKAARNAPYIHMTTFRLP
jgi:hypothetical protein